MEITYFLPAQDPASKTIAEFGLRVPELDMTFSRVKLIKGKNGQLFIAAPSFKQGEEFKPYWAFGESEKKGRNDAIMNALREFHIKQFGKTLEGVLERRIVQVSMQELEGLSQSEASKLIAERERDEGVPF